jgi:DNA polymerase-3 subunit gamma/tau
MGKALYRKYRPKELSQVVGQEHITTTLTKALKSGRISHAYLFSGPRGVGKTSIARILAHEINGLEYTDDSAHLDIIEIDAASNRRIDEIRDLRDKVYIAPTSGKYKVYIIDEVHMLTREAFNALLKTLEEPPAHVVFILATTEAHKLPDTIISRTQHYTFKPVDKEQVIKHLGSIAKKEKIEVTPEALNLLAAHGQGSFRDSISLLDQAASIETKVDAEEVRRLLGIAPDSAIDQLITSLKKPGDGAVAILQELNDLYNQGLQAAAIASQLAARIRMSLAEKKPLLAIDISLRLLRELIEVQASHNPERLLEIILMEVTDTSSMPAATITIPPMPAELPKNSARGGTDEIIQEPTTPISEPEPSKKFTKAQPQKSVEKQSVDPLPVGQIQPIEEPAATVSTAVAPQAMKSLDEAAWPEVLNGIKKQYNTLYGVLRMARPIFTDDEVELQFKFAFHQKRLNEVKNRKIISDFIKQVTGKNIAVRCTVNKDAAPIAASAVVSSPSTSTPAVLDSISDIFGGGEMLQ